MKEDITQLIFADFPDAMGCGLVMKEDITQLQNKDECKRVVVVW